MTDPTPSLGRIQAHAAGSAVQLRDERGAAFALSVLDALALARTLRRGQAAGLTFPDVGNAARHLHVLPNPWFPAPACELRGPDGFHAVLYQSHVRDLSWELRVSAHACPSPWRYRLQTLLGSVQQILEWGKQGG